MQYWQTLKQYAARLDRMRAMRSNGISYRKIAEQFGITGQRVHALLKRRGKK